MPCTSKVALASPIYTPSLFSSSTLLSQSVGATTISLCFKRLPFYKERACLLVLLLINNSQSIIPNHTKKLFAHPHSVEVLPLTRI
jgi:hypothetical protein